MNVHPFIEAEKSQQHNVKRACELLKVSRSAFYADRDRRPVPAPARTTPNSPTRSPPSTTSPTGTYGAPRVHAVLADTGSAALHADASPGSCAPLAHAARAPQRWRTTTVPDPAAALPSGPDPSGLRHRHRGPRHPLVRRHHLHPHRGRVALPGHRHRHRARAGSSAGQPPITCAPTWSPHALTNAVASRRPAPRVIFHSDRGCQYTSSQYRHLADQFGVRLSVGRPGQCWDNAVAESFFATIKTELLDRRAWPTRAAAHTAIFNWIEGWYNSHRLHSTLDYLSPAAYEKMYQQPGLRQVA